MGASIWNPTEYISTGSNTALLVDYFVATAGQTVFLYSNVTAVPGTNCVLVQLDGLWLPFNTYTVGATGITLDTPCKAGQQIQLIGFQIVLTGALSENVSYSPTGGVPTNVAAKLAQSVSVKDWGARGNGSADDRAAIQACINANPYKQIYFPTGTYVISAGLTITVPGVYLQGAGIGNTVLKYTGTNGDAVTFYSTSTATTGTYLSTGGIDGIQIRRDSTATTGSGLRLRQCFLFDVGDVRIDNFPGSYLQEGGAFIRIKNIRVLMSLSIYSAYVPGSWQYKFTAAPIDGGLYQQPYTTQIACLQSGTQYLSEYGIWIMAADGITLADGYIAAAYTSLLRFEPAYTGVNISSISMGTTYFDAVNQVGGTAGCVEAIDGGFGSGSLLNNIDISNCATIGNTPGKGLYSNHPRITSFKVDPSVFINCAGAEIDVASGDVTGDSWIGISLPWTPTISFDTPGNLSVTYATQAGAFTRHKDGTATVDFTVETSAFTHTTASGDLQVAGLPASSPSSVTTRAYGACAFNGITKANYTTFQSFVGSNTTSVKFVASGSAQSLAFVVAGDCPTGGTMILSGSVTYRLAELG